MHEKHEENEGTRGIRWVVVRCSGALTLEALDALGNAGIGVWTPKVWASKRVPRKKVRHWRWEAIMPSYLFIDLEDLARATAAKHPADPSMSGRVLSLETHKPITYTIQMIRGNVMIVGDADLEGLRRFDKAVVHPKSKKLPLPDRPALKAGDFVRIRGLFEGQTGTVQKLHDASAEATLILTGDKQLRVRVSMYLLDLVTFGSAK